MWLDKAYFRTIYNFSLTSFFTFSLFHTGIQKCKLTLAAAAGRHFY